MSFMKELEAAQLIKYQLLPVEISNFLVYHFNVCAYIISFLFFLFLIMTTAPQALLYNKKLFCFLSGSHANGPAVFNASVCVYVEHINVVPG